MLVQTQVLGQVADAGVLVEVVTFRAVVDADNLEVIGTIQLFHLRDKPPHQRVGIIVIYMNAN